MQEVNTVFTGGRSSGSGAERETKLKELASAHDAFFELKANLTEGTKVRKANCFAALESRSLAVLQ